MTRRLLPLLLVLTGACTAPPRALGGRPRPALGAPLVGDLLCLSMHFPLGDSAADLAERTRRLDHAEALGVRKVRRDIHWHKLEPVPNELHWERFDPGVQDVQARGLELIALLVYGVPWATTATENDNNYPPDDPADFARYAGRVAERYGDEVRLFEVWNEPNNGWRFWKPTVGGDPIAYGALLQAAHAAIKEVRPDAVVLYGGTVFHEQIIIPGAVQFLEEHFAAWPDAAQDFDALAFHPYPWYPPIVPPEEDGEPEMSFLRMADTLRTFLTDHDAGEKPLYATEFGWPSFGAVTRELQAAYLVRGTLWLAAAGARAACWYTLGDGSGTGTAPPEDDFGLIDWDVAAGAPGSPKPAYYAMQTLSATLGETAFVRDLTAEVGLEPGAHALLFATRDGATQIRVVWTVAEGDDRSVSLETLGGELAVLDAFGQAHPFELEDDTVTVTAKVLPIYVVDRSD